ncbi:MAG TPA: chloride channel protein [Candidatus Cybelea sp.]|jgi:CIC family chloride channel protein
MTVNLGPIELQLPTARYVETTRGYRFEFGRLSLSQSTFLLLAAVVVGLGGGLGAVGFRYLIFGESRLAMGVIAPALSFLGRANVVPVLIAGGIITSFIVWRFAKEAKGHGVPEVMAAVALRAGIIRPRVIAVKSLASATCIGFGGSCGREGPIVQIGSAIGSVLGQICRAPSPIVRTLVACGAASGISATFNAPIGGVFFASEVILGRFEPRSFASIVVASVVAAVIGRSFFGNHPSFTASAFYLVSPAELALYALLGIVAALWAAGFVKLLYYVEDRFDAWRITSWVKAAAGFGIVGIIGIRYPQVFGVGYDSVDAVLSQHVPALHALALAALKPVATSLTLGAGGSGGIFAPSLFTGAMLGDAFGTLAHAAFPSWTASAAAYGLVAMAAVFAAAAEAPITSIMIVFEMSSDYTIILPLMVSTVIATLLGRRLLGHTIYEMKLIRQGIDWMRARNPGFFSRVRVSAVERQAPVIAQSGETVREVAARLRDTDELAIPLVAKGRFVGLVAVSEIAVSLAQGSDGELRIDELGRPPTVTLSSTDSLEKAAISMADPRTPLLPVVDPKSGAFMGVVTRRDVLNAYRSAAEASMLGV